MRPVDCDGWYIILYIVLRVVVLLYIKHWHANDYTDRVYHTAWRKEGRGRRRAILVPVHAKTRIKLISTLSIKNYTIKINNINIKIKKKNDKKERMCE